MKKNQSHYLELKDGSNDYYSVLYRLKISIVYEKPDGELSIFPMDKDMIMESFVIKPTLRSSLGGLDQVGYAKEED